MLNCYKQVDLQEGKRGWLISTEGGKKSARVMSFARVMLQERKKVGGENPKFRIDSSTTRFLEMRT